MNSYFKNHFAIILSVVISFLFVAIITYSATTISTNIDTGGTLTVSGNATSTFGTGGFTVGTSQFVVQQTSGNVGIGTTSPHASLTVSNDFFIAANSNTWSSNTRKGLYIRYSDWLTQDSAYIQSIDRATNTPYPMWFEASSYYFKESGNVGIGTTTPNWLLQAAGTRPFFTLSDTAAGTNLKHWYMSSQGGNLYVGTTTDAYATTTGYQALTITNAGNVGIGTTGPNEKLEISSTLPIIRFTDSDSSGDSAKSYVAFYDQDNFLIGYIGDRWGSTDDIYLKADSGALHLGDNTGGDVIVLNTGNVGIGTTTPNRLLNIAGNAGPQLLLTQPGAGTDFKHWYASTTNGSLTFGVLNDSLSTLTERLRIDNFGRLGIGTTTPTTMFQVATSTANATTTIEVGKSGQNKGSCLKMYDVAGTVQYVSIQGGSFAISATSCE